MRPTGSYLKVFKAKDVQDANRAVELFAFDAPVDALDDPLEAAAIQVHGQGIYRVCCLRTRTKERDINLLWKKQHVAGTSLP